MNDRGASIGNGPEANGALNNSGPTEPVRHGYFCTCSWCLV